jgi:hypothetical protein
MHSAAPDTSFQGTLKTSMCAIRLFPTTECPAKTYWALLSSSIINGFASHSPDGSMIRPSAAEVKRNSAALHHCHSFARIHALVLHRWKSERHLAAVEWKAMKFDQGRPP